VLGVGFVIAAVAPIVACIVRDLTSGFTISWTMLATSLGSTVVVALRSYERAMRGKAEKPKRRMAQEQRV
jgi:MFS transporter, CP family, cyanate transporter